MSYSRIRGTGSYLPEKILSNQDLEKLLDTTDDWIVERTGIRKRHIAARGETSSDMGVAAARQAIDMAGIQSGDIDLIVVATSTPDKVFPSTACILQRKLGIAGCPAFDINAACAGFIYALDTADRYIKTGGARHVLVVGTEVYSRILNWTDRTTAVLFGDGAGAVVLSASDTPGVLSTHIHADGQFEELLQVPRGISSGYEDVQAGEAYITMSGNAVFRKAVGLLDLMARELLDDHCIDLHDIDWLVPHQANLRIISATAKKFDLPMERVIVTVDQHANTSSASIPLALDVAVRDGRIKAGQMLMFEAFGAGFTWGSALLKF